MEHQTQWMARTDQKVSYDWDVVKQCIQETQEKLQPGHQIYVTDKGEVEHTLNCPGCSVEFDPELEAVVDEFKFQ